MLVVHGGKDYRVVDTQGMATFTALQRKGIPSKFLYFPDENHWVLKPQNSIAVARDGARVARPVDEVNPQLFVGVTGPVPEVPCASVRARGVHR